MSAHPHSVFLLLGCIWLFTAEVQAQWLAKKICDDCLPQRIIVGNSGDALVITQPLVTGGVSSAYATTDAGRSWQPTGSLFNVAKEYWHGSGSPSPGSYFFIYGQFILYTTDYGMNWNFNWRYPLVETISMESESRGSGFYPEADTFGVSVMVMGTLDSGKYWYENLTGKYFDTISFRDGIRLSASTYLSLHSSYLSTSRVHRWDGNRWNTYPIIEPGDSSTVFSLAEGSDSSQVVAVAAGKSLLALSFDGGRSWKQVRDFAGGRVSAVTPSRKRDERLTLWASVGKKKVLPRTDPFLYLDFPDTLMFSVDSGVTWNTMDYGAPAGSAIHEVAIDTLGSVFVTSTKDSSVYVSTLRQPLQHVTNFEGPSRDFSVTHLDSRYLAFTPFVSGPGSIRIIDLAGREILHHSLVLRSGVREKLSIGSLAGSSYRIIIELPGRLPTSYGFRKK